MFDPTSRYFTIEEAVIIITHPHNDRKILYKRRRFIPPSEALTILHEISVTAGERLDNITARTLGDPLQFWRICDANNNTRHPLELTSTPGRTIKIPLVGR
jgi:hypothetical protein